MTLRIAGEQHVPRMHPKRTVTPRNTPRNTPMVRNILSLFVDSAAHFVCGSHRFQLLAFGRVGVCFWEIRIRHLSFSHSLPHLLSLSFLCLSLSLSISLSLCCSFLNLKIVCVRVSCCMCENRSISIHQYFHILFGVSVDWWYRSWYHIHFLIIDSTHCLVWF